MTFQQDLRDTFIKIHDEYNEKFKAFISKDSIFDQMSVDEASVIVTNLQRYSELMESVGKVFINEDSDQEEDEITIELQKKMLPIMILYRQVLELKHRKITNTIQYKNDL
jgi:hypothetical protein